MIAVGKTNSHLLTETICGISEVPKLIPGRPPAATVWRWTKRGIRGTLLETDSIGGRVLTSHEAVHRFLAPVEFIRRGDNKSRGISTSIDYRALRARLRIANVLR